FVRDGAHAPWLAPVTYHDPNGTFGSKTALSADPLAPLRRKPLSRLSPPPHDGHSGPTWRAGSRDGRAARPRPRTQAGGWEAWPPGVDSRRGWAGQPPHPPADMLVPVTANPPTRGYEGGIVRLTHLQRLEAESIHIIREVVAEFERPVMLYSIGKDSSVMVHLARKAFHRGKLPFPLLHIDTTWKFREMIEFRDRFCAENGFELRVHANKQGLEENINPFDHGSQKYTTIMKTHALLQALHEGQYDAAFGGARRDEERSRAKERIYSFRDRYGQWDPKNQRPELWNLYNAKINKGESIRVF